MGKWRPAPAPLVALLDAAMAGFASQRRLMFGFPAYFHRGYMVSGVFEDRLFLRLPEASLAALRSKGSVPAHLEPLPGRPMRDYYVIPPRLLTRADRLRRLVADSIDHAESLPPKSSTKSARTVRKGSDARPLPSATESRRRVPRKPRNA